MFIVSHYVEFVSFLLISDLDSLHCYSYFILFLLFHYTCYFIIHAFLFVISSYLLCNYTGSVLPSEFWASTVRLLSIAGSQSTTNTSPLNQVERGFLKILAVYRLPYPCGSVISYHFPKFQLFLSFIPSPSSFSCSANCFVTNLSDKIETISQEFHISLHLIHLLVICYCLCESGLSFSKSHSFIYSTDSFIHYFLFSFSLFNSSFFYLQDGNVPKNAH